MKLEQLISFRQAPTDWAMYSEAGNKRIYNYATTALRQAEEAVLHRGDRSYKTASRICVAFLAKWYRLGYKKGFEEASDTAVREEVGYWHDYIWNVVTENSQNDMWMKHLDEAYERVRKEKNKKYDCCMYEKKECKC